MGTICGILGREDRGAVDLMARAMSRGGDLAHRAAGEQYTVASTHPIGEGPHLFDGEPVDMDGQRVSPAAVLSVCKATAATGNTALRGAFAGVVGTETAWYLLRDRLGRKPLYYYRGPDFTLFASELKGLLASGLVPKRLNLQAVDHYLALRCVPGGESMIQDVYRVPAGHVVTLGDGEPSSRCFGEFTLDAASMTREQAAQQLRDTLQTALHDGEYDAVLWSAGIDCAALAASRDSLSPLFVSLERTWQNETRLARESARLMHRKLHSVTARRLTEETFLQVVRDLDEPIADASVFPLWLIAEAAAEHGTRFAAGFGADELLGGYPRYHFLGKASGGAKGLVPAGLMSDILPALPPNAFVRRGSQYLASIHDSTKAYLALISVFDQDEREELYTEAMKAVLYEHRAPTRAVEAHFTGPDLTRNLLALDLHVALPDLLLMKCDRIARAHNIELHLPFLDDCTVDLATQLAPEVKYGVRSKPVLRSAMKGVLPGRIRLRARRSFQTPQSGRLVKVFNHVAQQTITPERVDATGLFRWGYVSQILRTANHNIYRRRQYWALLMFFAWYRAVLE